MRADEALHEIDGVAPLISSIQSEMLVELKETFAGIGSYVTVEEIERNFQADPDAPAPAVLEQAFQDNFGHAAEGFNKTLLHYLLTRLGKVSPGWLLRTPLNYFSSDQKRPSMRCDIYARWGRAQRRSRRLSLISFQQRRF